MTDELKAHPNNTVKIHLATGLLSGFAYLEAESILPAASPYHSSTWHWRIRWKGGIPAEVLTDSHRSVQREDRGVNGAVFLFAP